MTYPDLSNKGDPTKKNDSFTVKNRDFKAEWLGFVGNK